MNIDRRTFLKQLAVEAGSVPSLTPFSYGPAVMEATPGSQSVLSDAKNRTLLVVQLGGGNDGINTVVPYGQHAYYQARPTLALQPNELLQIDGNVGLHPSMGGLMNLFKSHNAAILQG
ncbi:MAG: transcriptional initiation protein Tat, partial [Thaumarchaeota archaeon]|nr:transcriptional initiation protein Tat [Nitrososphaerota archaeon]